MVRRKPIEVLAPGKPGRSCEGNRKIVGLDINWAGRSICVRAAVSDGPATLGDLVPLARAVSDRIAAASVERCRREKCRIPCRKGCSACCGYLVPLSVPEAIRLGRDMQDRNASEHKKMVRKSLLAARRILNHQPPSIGLQEPGSASDGTLQSISEWYSGMDIACPFLANRSCSIYAQRPLACREYLVEGTSAACSGRSKDARIVEPPLRMVEVLGQLAAELENTAVEAVVLPLAVAWNDMNSERARRCWPAPMMVRRLFQLVDAACRAESRQFTA